MIRLLQHYTPNFKQLIDITKRIHEAYCAKHGYSFHLKEVPQYEKYTGLDKLNQILEVCEEGDIAMVMDADALVTNQTVKIEDFIVRGHCIYLSGNECFFNMGIFIVRYSWVTKAVLSTIINSINTLLYNCEQDAFEKSMKYINSYFYPSPFSFLNHPSINSYLSELYPEIPQPVTKEQGQWGHGCFILHLPALPLEKRIELLKEYSQYIIYE